LAASAWAVGGVDSSHALVNYIANIPNEGSSYTVDATPETGGQGNSDNYATRDDAIARKSLGSSEASSIECTRSDSAGTTSKHPAATGCRIESVEAIGQTGMA